MNLRYDDSSQYGGKTTGAIAYGYRCQSVTAAHGRLQHRLQGAVVQRSLLSRDSNNPHAGAGDLAQCRGGRVLDRQRAGVSFETRAIGILQPGERPDRVRLRRQFRLRAEQRRPRDAEGRDARARTCAARAARRSRVARSAIADERSHRQSAAATRAPARRHHASATRPDRCRLGLRVRRVVAALRRSRRTSSRWAATASSTLPRNGRASRRSRCSFAPTTSSTRTTSSRPASRPAVRRFSPACAGVPMKRPVPSADCRACSRSRGTAVASQTGVAVRDDAGETVHARRARAADREPRAQRDGARVRGRRRRAHRRHRRHFGLAAGGAGAAARRRRPCARSRAHRRARVPTSSSPGRTRRRRKSRCCARAASRSSSPIRNRSTASPPTRATSARSPEPASTQTRPPWHFARRVASLRDRYAHAAQAARVLRNLGRRRSTRSGVGISSRRPSRCAAARTCSRRCRCPAPEVSVEAVLAARPEAIVAGTDGAVRPPWLDDWKRWPELPAARSGHLLRRRRRICCIATGHASSTAPRRLCAALDAAR